MNSTDLSHVSPWLSAMRRAHEMVRKAAKKFARRRKPRPFSEFIAFKETLTAAKAAGLSVGEYIERKHSSGAKTALDQTMDRLDSLGVFKGPIERVCEIGPGSGRYLAKTLTRVRPSLYEIYETSSEWRNWLVQQYGVAARRCDGKSLTETESASMDLVQAHKLFAGLPFLTSISYFHDMARVTRDGGWIVFDIMTEACFTREYLNAWFNAEPWDWAWSPHVMPRDFTLSMFAERGINLAGSFQVPLFPAFTECLVFRKGISQETRKE